MGQQVLCQVFLASHPLARHSASQSGGEARPFAEVHSFEVFSEQQLLLLDDATRVVDFNNSEPGSTQVDDYWVPASASVPLEVRRCKPGEKSLWRGEDRPELQSARRWESLKNRLP